MKTTMTSFKCPDYLREYLKKLGKKLDRSRSYMIVKILGEHKEKTNLDNLLSKEELAELKDKPKEEPLTAAEIREQNK